MNHKQKTNIMNQEEIVDNIILDMLDLKRPGSKEQILSRTTKSKRRLAMLSILDDNRQLFNDYKKIVSNNPPHACGEYSTDVVQLLGKYAKVADIDVKKHGEVMTPLTLVNEMLDTLPKEVWSNPNLKWLDPCNGIGTFPSVIVERLMIGLKDVIIGDCDRYRHIIENMLYVCEIQPKNMFLFHCAFDREDNHRLNTFCGSFLTEEFNEHMKNEWKIDKFDIVVGNPPYQTNNPGERKTHPIWQLFVEKSISILSEGGYLNMVHPNGWRSVGGKFKKTQKLMTSKQIEYVKFHTFKDGSNTFGAKINYDFYCLKNIPNNNYKTKIVCENGVIEKLDLSKMEFIPGENISEIYSLIANDNEEKVEVLYSRTLYGTDKSNMNKINENSFIHPCIYTVNHINEPKFWYSNTKDKFFNTPKVIWGNGASGVMIDMNGDYGLTQFAYGIIDEPINLPLIEKALKNKRFISKIMLFKDSLGDKYNRKVIATFRKDFWKEFIND